MSKVSAYLLPLIGSRLDLTLMPWPVACHPSHEKEHNTAALYAYDNVADELRFHCCVSQHCALHLLASKLQTLVCVRHHARARAHSTEAQCACGNVVDDGQLSMGCSCHLRRGRRVVLGTEQVVQHGRADIWRAWRRLALGSDVAQDEDHLQSTGDFGGHDSEFWGLSGRNWFSESLDARSRYTGGLGGSGSVVDVACEAHSLTRLS